MKNWQCNKCGRLLGVFQEGVLQIKVKAYQYTVEDGRVQAVCPNPRCRFLNIVRVNKVV